MNVRLAMLLIATTPLFAQDAASVLNRYVQVTGGSDLYKRYNSLHLFYTVTHADKSTENVDYFHTRDGKLLLETDTGVATLDIGVSDAVAWKFSESKGAQILTGKEAARLLADSKGFDEDDWQIRYPTVALLPNQTVNNSPCRHLKLTRTDGSTLERFYEIKSGLLIREISTQFDSAGIEQPVTTDVGRYDTFFGLRRPVHLIVKTPSGQAEIQINTVTYSPTPDAALNQLPHDVVRLLLASKTKPGGLPNPAELIDKLIAATGGRDNYQRVKTEVIKADVSFVTENLKFPVVTDSSGNKHYSSADIPSIGKMETGDDGVTGWENSAMIGPKLRPHSVTSEFTGPEPQQILHWSDSAMTMETLSQDQVNGSPCFLVRLGPKSDQAATACFDTKSGLLSKTKSGEAEQTYTDYRAASGLTIPYRIETKITGHTSTVQITDVVINQPLPPDIFNLPPEIKALKAKRDAPQH